MTGSQTWARLVGRPWRCLEEDPSIQHEPIPGVLRRCRLDDMTGARVDHLPLQQRTEHVWLSGISARPLWEANNHPAASPVSPGRWVALLDEWSRARLISRFKAHRSCNSSRRHRVAPRSRPSECGHAIDGKSYPRSPRFGTGSGTPGRQVLFSHAPTPDDMEASCQVLNNRFSLTRDAPFHQPYGPFQILLVIVSLVTLPDGSIKPPRPPLGAEA